MGAADHPQNGTPTTVNQTALLVLATAAATLTVATTRAATPPQGGRSVFDLNRDWRYHRGEVNGDASRVDLDDASWERVALPHTYELASINLNDSEDDASQPTFHRDVGWYRRTLPALETAGRRVFLEFEGAHQVTDVWVNGRHVGQHATGGYTPFHFDITGHLREGNENHVTLRLDNRPNPEVPPDGHTRDYVLFGGLYRDVRLVVTDELHVTFPWEARDTGVRITTPSVSGQNATVTVETNVRNEGPADRTCQVVTLVADADGVVVERLATEVTVPPGRSERVVQTGGVREGLRLWSCDSPYLYRVHTLLVESGRPVDHVVNPLGFRWFELRPEVGFVLNGEPVELIGANRHQQYPYVGDAVPNNLHRGDAVKMKRAGLNVVRLAHYPHDDAFLNACDELGLLVCEEAPTWIEFGPPLWQDRLEQAQRVMIRNHRNHPCVWGWAGGINHRGPVPRLHYAAKEEDPTRITMSNSTLWTGPTHSGVTDLYSVMDYRGAKVPPGGFLFGMEHSGSLDAKRQQRLVSLYRSDPRRIGLTLWSAHDGPSFKKRGERYPNLSRWNAALWDAFRTPKPAYDWYRSELTDEPMVHLPDERAQSEGSVTVFSNCDEVALVVDGQETERRGPSVNDSTGRLRSPPFVFPVAGEPTEVTAVGYRDGREAARHTTRRPGKPHHLEVEFDLDGFGGAADGSSLLMAYARVCDERGTVVPVETPPVRFELSGPGRIVGDERIGANPVVWERGVAPVMVRVGTEAGELRLTATAPGLAAGTTTTRLAAPPGDELRFASPTERRRLRIDLGGEEQHVEPGWTSWRHVEGVSTIVYADRIGPDVALSLSGREPPGWTSSWGVPGDLCFLIEDGAESRGEIVLTLRGLDAGRYAVRTWHHRVVDNREAAPPIDVRVDDAHGKARLVAESFSPTYGRRIHVSEDGGGSAGDGGSDLAAANDLEFDVHASAGGEVVIRFATTGSTGPITLNGFELLGEPRPYTFAGDDAAEGPVKE